MCKKAEVLEASGPHRIVAESEGSSGAPYIDFGCGSCSCPSYLAILFRYYSDPLHVGATLPDLHRRNSPGSRRSPSLIPEVLEPLRR
jgi:hypothetical protein